MTSIILLLIYVSCSALGLILLKMGINNGAVISLSTGFIEIKLHLILIGGAILYIFSFLLNMVVMSKFNLNYVYPISAGLIYIAIVGLSVMILKEKVTGMQIIGMLAILIGIIIMNIGNK